MSSKPSTDPRPMTRDAYLSAVQRATAAAAAYYGSGATLLLADADYDALVDAITEYEADHPDQAVVHGLTSAVAAGTVTGGTVTHTVPMLSLEKVKDAADLTRWLNSVNTPVTVSVKVDGLAVTAHYRDGVLVQAATRGDGTTGEDVTAQVLRGAGIAGLPATLPRPATFDVRGEIFMTDDDFDVSNAARIAAGKTGYANPRNATAGSLRRETADYDVAMSFAAYGQVGVDNATDHVTALTDLSALGITTTADLMPALAGVFNGADQVTEALTLVESDRPRLGFPIDGAVIAVNNYAARDALGTGSRAPKWAVAYKFAPTEASSVLRDIEVSVGRTGRIGLRGRIDPVTVDGSTVEYATLHNPKFVVDQGLGIGSTVMVVKAGDVIPRITAALGDQPADVTPWTPPAVCPQCGGEWDTSTLLWRCTSPECGVIPACTYAVSRDGGWDVDGLSDAIVTALVETGRVNDIADLLTLTVDDLAATPLGTTSTGATRTVGGTVATKIHAGLQAAKAQPWNRQITSWGLRMTGRTMGRRLAAAFPTMDTLRAATVDDLATVDGIGVEKATVIRAELDRVAALLDRLVAAGINTGTPAADADADALPLAGKTVVVTGAMTGPLAALTRNDMNELIEARGGKASGSVSSKTSLLVCGEPGSSKYGKAESLGIPIVSPDEFAHLIGYTG